MRLSAVAALYARPGSSRTDLVGDSCRERERRRLLLFKLHQKGIVGVGDGKKPAEFVFDGATRTLHYVNAGHNPPMVIRLNGSIIWLEAGGAPVGLFPDSTYEEGAVQLNPGDLVVAYTDGVIEAVSPAGEAWGIDDLRGAAAESGAQHPDDVVHALFTSMDELTPSRRCDSRSPAGALSFRKARNMQKLMASGGTEMSGWRVKLRTGVFGTGLSPLPAPG